MRNRSLRRFFALLCMVMVLVVSGFVFANAMIMRRAFMNNADEYLVRAHNQALESVAGFFKEAENGVYSMCYSPSTQAYLKETSAVKRMEKFKDVQAIYANVAYTNSALASFAVYDADGLFITANGSSYPMIVQQSALQPSAEMRYSTVPPGNCGRTRSDGFLTVPILETYVNSRVSQRIIGTLVFTLDLSGLRTQFQALALIPRSAVMLVTSDGTPLVSSDANATFDVARAKVLRQSAVGSTGWSLTTSYETGVIAEDMQYILTVTLLSGGTIILLIIAFVLFLSRKVLQPIGGVARYMRGVSTSADVAPYQPGRRGYEELDMMVEAMNEMLSALREKTDALVEQEKRAVEAEMEANRLEILAYRSQINPHFLYNTLDCIGGMAYQHDAMEIAEISQALSGMFRYAIKGPDFVTVEEELLHLREYTVIIGHRFRGRIRIEVHATVAALAQRVPRLILQPIVENAVFHGVEKKVGGGNVWVNVSREDGMLRFRVENDGQDMEPEQLDELIKRLEADEPPTGERGVGLWNISRRLKLFSNGAAIVRIDRRDAGGVIVEIVLPETEGGDEVCIRS